MTVVGEIGKRAQNPEPAGEAPTIDVRDLRMRYGSVDVLKGIGFTAHRGEVITLLGPNGAGKTTTIEILEGFRMRSGGEVSVLGVDPGNGNEDWRARMGVVLQSWRDHGRWRVRDLLCHLGRYYLPYSTPERQRPYDVDELIQTVGLGEQAGQKIATLSGGQRRRLDVAIGIIGRPEVVFLDEAEKLADRILILAGGRIVANGSADQLIRQVAGQAEVRWSRGGEHLVHSTDDAARFVRELFAQHGEEIADLEVRRASLEDTYMAMVHRHETGHVEQAVTGFEGASR